MDTEVFVEGEVYRRRDLHANYGGQRQGGISTPADKRMIMLFTGVSGHQYGYQDGRRPDGTFWYTGEEPSSPLPSLRPSDGRINGLITVWNCGTGGALQSRPSTLQSWAGNTGSAFTEGKLQAQRHRIPKDSRIAVKSILGDLHHEYRLESIAA